MDILLPYHCTFYNTYFSSIVIRRYLILIKFLNGFARLRFSSVLESDLVNYRFREISISLKSSKNVVKLVYNNVLIWLNFCSICSDVSFLIIDVIFNCYCSLFPPKFLQSFLNCVICLKKKNVIWHSKATETKSGGGVQQSVLTSPVQMITYS